MRRSGISATTNIVLRDNIQIPCNEDFNISSKQTNIMGNHSASRRQHEDAPLDDLFDALANHHRRQLLSTLLDSKPETEIPVPETLTVRMNHAHLPRLDEAGYIEWDRERDVIRRGSRFDDVLPIITIMRENDHELPGEWP